jgi:hypothetical protein
LSVAGYGSEPSSVRAKPRRGNECRFAARRTEDGCGVWLGDGRRDSCDARAGAQRGTRPNTRRMSKYGTVTVSGGPTAGTISVRQTLELLDTEHRSLAEGVANGRYAFWLGSGISRDRVPGLQPIVLRVLEFLRTNSDPADPNCPHRQALNAAIGLAHLRPDELVEVDYSAPVESWPPRQALTESLAERYSQLLDISVAGRPADYLLWDGVDVRESYPADAEPDCEHLCIAILCMEGLIPQAASANWDGLIESAVRELSGEPAKILKIVVLPDEIRLPDRQTRLLKFHGCAILAAQDPDRYREAIVASESQIVSWPSDPAHNTMKDAMKALAVARPTFVVGLSLQDNNILAVFSAARTDLPWTWPSDPPAHMFADDELGQKHRTLLKIVYEDAYEQDGPEIEQTALIRAYAEQILCALVLHTFAAKLSAFLAKARTSLEDTQLEELGGGVIVLRDLLADAAEPDRLAFTRSFVEREGRGMSLFRSGEEPPVPGRYDPLSRDPLEDIADDINLPTSGMPELAGGLALIGSGVAQHHWQVSLDATSTGHTGAFTLTPAGQPATAVYFSASPRASAQLALVGISTAAGDVVIIHSTGIPQGPTRSPGGRYGRRGRGGPRDVDMADLLKTSEDLAELRRRFREAAVL